MVAFTCSLCGDRGDVDDSYKGQAAQCRKCGTPNDIPDDDEWFEQLVDDPVERAVMQAEEVQRASRVARHASQSQSADIAKTHMLLRGIYTLLVALFVWLLFFVGC